MRKNKKIDQLIKDDRLFFIGKGNNNEYFVCKGLSGNVYNIVFNPQDNSYSCSCKNMRNTNCYHIKALLKLKDSLLI